MDKTVVGRWCDSPHWRLCESQSNNDRQIVAANIAPTDSKSYKPVETSVTAMVLLRTMDDLQFFGRRNPCSTVDTPVIRPIRLTARLLYSPSYAIGVAHIKPRRVRIWRVYVAVSLSSLTTHFISRVPMSA